MMYCFLYETHGNPLKQNFPKGIIKATSTTGAYMKNTGLNPLNVLTYLSAFSVLSAVLSRGFRMQFYLR